MSNNGNLSLENMKFQHETSVGAPNPAFIKRSVFMGPSSSFKVTPYEAPVYLRMRVFSVCMCRIRMNVRFVLFKRVLLSATAFEFLPANICDMCLFKWKSKRLIKLLTMETLWAESVFFSQQMRFNSVTHSRSYSPPYTTCFLRGCEVSLQSDCPDSTSVVNYYLVISRQSGLHPNKGLWKRADGWVGERLDSWLFNVRWEQVEWRQRYQKYYIFLGHGEANVTTKIRILKLSCVHHRCWTQCPNTFRVADGIDSFDLINKKKNLKVNTPWRVGYFHPHPHCSQLFWSPSYSTPHQLSLD